LSSKVTLGEVGAEWIGEGKGEFRGEFGAEVNPFESVRGLTKSFDFFLTLLFYSVKREKSEISTSTTKSLYFSQEWLFSTLTLRDREPCFTSVSSLEDLLM